jgi:hypothetical protein
MPLSSIDTLDIPVVGGNVRCRRIILIGIANFKIRNAMLSVFGGFGVRIGSGGGSWRRGVSCGAQSGALAYKGGFLIPRKMRSHFTRISLLAG